MMTSTFATGILLFLILLCRPAMSLGINCRGSANCGFYHHVMPIMSALDISEYRTYANGEHIACIAISKRDTGGFCAFPQHLKGEQRLGGEDVARLLHDIFTHGCGVCGSVPVGYPASNDPSQGILTVNYVYRTKCNGICN